MLGLPAEPRLDKGVPFSELRARETGGGGPMNLALSDEQELLREAARGTLGRIKPVEAARDALEDESTRPDLWPTAVDAGWPGLLISEQHGGAELGAFDAMLVAEECGRVLAPVPLLGLLPATAILDAAGHESLAQSRPASCGPRTCRRGHRATSSRAGRSSPAPARPAPTRPERGSTATRSCSTGPSRSCRTCPVRNCSSSSALTAGGAPVAAAVAADADGVSTESLWRYDATRPLGHVTFDGARGTRLDVSADTLAGAWYLAHALIAAESIGAVRPAWTSASSTPRSAIRSAARSAPTSRSSTS